MALNPQRILDPILVIASVALMVTAGVQLGYFLIDSTITRSHDTALILKTFKDPALAWRWWAPFGGAILCLIARRAILRKVST